MNAISRSREPHSIWLEIEGLRTHCLTAGEQGSPVVLLHGGGVDSAALSWDDVIGHLGARHRVFAPDLPGYGQSARPAIQYTIDFYVRFVTHLMDALGLERTSLVGLSMGGGIALGLTLAEPARVQRLVLVAPYGIQDRVALHRLSYFYVHLPFVNRLTYWLLSKSRSLVRWTLLAGLIHDPAHLSDELVDQAYQAVRAPRAAEAFMSFQEHEVQWSGLRTNFTARLPEIKVPTLLVHGAHDSAVPLADVQRAHTLISGSELYVMPETKHWPQREKPEEFNRVVGGFLDT